MVSALTSKRLMTDLAMLIVFALGGWFLFVTFIKGGATDAGTKRLHGDGDSDGGGWARVKGADGKTYTQWRGKPGMETEPGIVAGEGVHGEVVEIATNGVAGYTTYELLLQLNDVGKAAKTAPLNCYTIYGTADRPLEMPPAFQTDLPFGAHIGGTSPQFWAVKAEAEFDSWLTVSVTEGNTHDDLSAIGIDFESWSSKAQLYADNGAVFWTEPDNAPTFEAQPKGTPVARLTVKTGDAVNAVVNAQGRSTQAGADWEQRNIKFKLH